MIAVTLLAVLSWVVSDRQRLIRERDEALQVQQRIQKEYEGKLDDLRAQTDWVLEYRKQLIEAKEHFFTMHARVVEK